MKNIKILNILPILFLAACNGYNKNPVSDLSNLRQQGQAEVNKGPLKPTEITKTVVVEKPVVVSKEESTVDGKFIVITADPQMAFSEGQVSSFNIHARALKPGVQVSITPDSLPADAKLVASSTEPGLFVLTWQPALYTIAANTNIKYFPVTLNAKVIAAADPADMEKFKGLITSDVVTLSVSPNQELPSIIQISGLNAIAQEGQITAFSVTAKIPGIDGQSVKKPQLNFFYDNVIITSGNQFRELDGSRYIAADLNKKDPEYLGNSQWKFTVAFDTKNISVQPQLGLDGSVMKNADGTRVRFSLFIASPTGLRTPEVLKQLKIVYTKSMTAPKFNILGLAQQSLEVSRGQKISLSFTVDSAETSAQVFVSNKESTLPGAPQVICKTAKTGNFQQNCLMTWTVPCDTAVEKLKGSIDMSAMSSSSAHASESTDYSLQTIPAIQEQDFCSALKSDTKKPAKIPAKSTAKVVAGKVS